MALFLFTLVAIVLALIYYFFKTRYGYWEKMGVPYEPPLPVFGNMKGIGTTVHFRDINQRIYDKFKDFTPMAGMFTFFTKTAVITDLDLIKNILIKDFSNFHDRNLFNNVKDDPLTGHLVTLEGEQWRAMRNKLSPVFTGSRMRYMFPTITSVGENLAKVCGKLSAQSAEGDLEIKEVCARFTTDVIGTCAFGLECNSLNNPNAEFRNKGRSFIEKPRHSLLVLAFIVSNPEFARKLHMKFIADDVSEFFMNSVRETIDYRVKNNIKRNDFMDMMIEMRAKDEAAAKANNGIDLSQGLTFEQIAAQAFVFFIAGFDTSSSTMSLCLYELAKNAKVQEKLRKEVVDVLAKHNNELSYDAMKEMTYLDQVIAETLRMYPVLPQLVRKCMSDYRVPGTEYIIEKNLQVIIPIHAIHHDPAIFPNPDKFDPDRFTAEACNKRHPMAYLPFGEGPRNCIGMRFGKMQTKVGLIMLLRDYKFSKSSLTDDPLHISKKSFIISAEKGIHLKVERL